MQNIVYIFLLFLLATGCVTQAPAPIEYNTDRTWSPEKERTLKTFDDAKEITSKSTHPLAKDFTEPEGVLREPKLAPEEESQGGITREEIAEEIEGEEAIVLPKNLLNKPSSGKFIKPLTGSIITSFNEQTTDGKSNGINISAPFGTPIKSIAGGIIIYADTDSKFGNLVIVKLDKSELFVAYSHMEKLIVVKNSPVEQGQIIGHVGSSGNVAFPQLYLAIKEGKTLVDPLKYIPW